MRKIALLLAIPIILYAAYVLSVIYAADDGVLDACWKDSDCIVVQGVCVDEAINKKQKERAEEYFQAKRRAASCVPYIPSNGKAHCYNRTCKIEHL